MRKQVIDLLNDTKVTPEQKFNDALSLYRNSAHPNPGLVRGYNVKGYSPQRLEELVYDVKKAFDITDGDLAAKSVKVVKLNPKAPQKAVVPVTMPTFSKGAKGNAERKALVAALGLTAESNTNKNLEAAIQGAIDLADAKAKEVVAAETVGAQAGPSDEEKKAEAFKKVVSVIESGEKCPPSFVREVYGNADMTDDEANAIIAEATPEAPEPKKEPAAKKK